MMTKYGEQLSTFSVGFGVWHYDVGFLGGADDPGKGCFPLQKLPSG